MASLLVSGEESEAGTGSEELPEGRFPLVAGGPASPVPRGLVRPSVSNRRSMNRGERGFDLSVVTCHCQVQAV
jgi:hypothetical protein